MKAYYSTDKLLREASPPREWDNTLLCLPGKGGGCDRSTYWFLRGVVQKNTPPYFTYGKAWQDALGAWYTTDGDIATRLKAAFATATRVWAEDGAEGSGDNTLEKLKWLLVFYAAEYPEEHWKIVIHNNQMELGFCYPLRNTGYFLAGALDGYISWSSYGLLDLENKTSGIYLSDSFIAQWAWSTQVTQYFWGLSITLGSEPFGVLMNLACKRSVTDKAVKEFQNSGSVPDGAFSRSLEKRSAYQLEEFEKESYLVILDVEQEWTRWNWPKARDHMHCSGGIGKSPCPYRRLCLQERPFYELEEPEILGNDLAWRKEPWRPWERGNKKEEA
ncbi:MAG: hypothetical protein WC479_07295 [Candidatus Izemoplasmatales bacterium]